MTSKELITQLYVGYFDRAPDPAGLTFWINVLDSGALTLEEIAQDFAGQPEAQATYPFLNNDPAANVVADVEAFIEAIYENLFDREPEPAGLTFWSGVLQDGFPVGSFIFAIIEGAATADAEVLANKVEVACAWSDAATAEDGFVLSQEYIDGSGAALGDVSSDPATVAAGKDAAALFFQEAPEVALENTVTALDEDADTTARIKVADIVITDDGVGTNDLALTGDDAALFEIDGTELFLKAGTALDFETNASLDVTVTVDDAGVGASPDDSADLTITLGDVDEPPTVVLENALASLAEDADTTAALKVADIVVTDDSTGTAALALTGADAALFEISGTELFLKAGTVLDFETATSLDVTVTVDDPALGGSPDDTAALSLSITDVNEAPTVALSNTTTALSEDTDTAAALKVADITVTDDALGTNDLALDGADAGLFEIVGMELFLKAGTVLDFETNPALDVTVTVDDAGVGASPDDSAALSIAVGDVNEAPVITLSNTVTALDEDADTAAAIKVADVTVTDDAQGSNMLALSGADAGLFELVGSELFLKAGTALDFETNPVLDVSVTADDATIAGNPDASAPLAIAIGDVNEAPSVALSGTTTVLLENTDLTSRLKVADITLSDDGLGTNLLGLSGDDAALFEIDGTELFLKAGTVLDFEANPVLDVSVTADDAAIGATPDDSAPLAISVTDTNSAPEVVLSGVPASLPEDLDTATRVKVADIVVTDDVAGSNTLALTGADAALFEIDGTELFLKAGTTLDFETNPSLGVAVTVDDPTIGTGVEDTAAAAIAVTDANEPPSVSLTATLTTLSEDASTAARTKVADIVITDDALGTNVLALTGADAALFEIDGTELFLSAGVALDFETNPILDVSVTVDDADVGASPDGTAPFALNVLNVNEAPSLALLNTETELFEGTDTTGRVRVGTIQLSDDGTGVNTLSLSGADAALFEIDGTGLFLKAGTALDADANPVLDVTVAVEDTDLAPSPDDSVALAVTIAPGAPGAAADNTESLIFSGNAGSTVRFGQINVADADPDTPGNQPGFVLNTNPDGDPYAGVAGSVLSLIDATALDGLLSLGVISTVDGEDFTLDNSGSDGDVEACLGEGDVFGTLTTPELAGTGTWTFDNSGATGAMEISIKDLDLNAGGMLNFLNVDIVIEGDIDLTVLGDDLSIDAASTLEVAEGGTLTLTVAQVDDLEDAGIVLFGAGSVVVTGVSDDSDGEIDTDFGILRTAGVDLSAVTLDAGDGDGAVNITVSGAASDAVGTDLVVGGMRVAQNVTGTAENDAVIVASSATDADTGTLDVILSLGADDGDIGDPQDTPVGTADPAEMTGDTIDLDSSFANVQINADAGFDAVVGTGFSNRIDVQVSTGAEFYAPVVVSDYFATTDSSNEGTAVLEATGLIDRTISVSAATGSAGWTVIGAAGSTASQIIGSGEDDTLVDGVPNDDDNNNEEDEFTGDTGSDAFIFNVISSTPATFSQVEMQAALDVEYIDVTAANGADAPAALITIEYQLNNVTTVAVVNDTSAGFDIDFSDQTSIAAGIAAVMDGITGISAVVDGGDPTQINLEGDNGNLLDINSITPNGAAGTTSATVLGAADDDADNSNDAVDTGDDDLQVTEVTVTGTVTAGEVYFLTVDLASGVTIEAQYEAQPADTVDDVALGLLSNGDVTGINDIAGGQVVAAIGGSANVIEITDGDDDDGGFAVTLSLGQAVLGGSSASSLLDGTEASLSVADADVINDFVDDDDTISFGLAGGTPDNYDEAAREADFVDALAAANAAFAGDADLIYFLTGSDVDATGLLFVNANDNGAADTVVAMTGITENNFDEDNIV